MKRMLLAAIVATTCLSLDVPPYPSPPQFTVNLVENIQRLKLDVAQVLHIHGGTDAMAVVVKAAGRQAPSQ